MIHFHNLTLGYERHPVIHHLHGEVATGSLLAIVGPNGGGKSTLLKGILGQLAPLGGEIRLAVDRQEIGYLPQQSRIDRQFPITVREVVAMGLWRHCGLFGRLAHSQRARVAAALERVGLENMAEARLEALSPDMIRPARYCARARSSSDWSMRSPAFCSSSMITGTSLPMSLRPVAA